MTFGEKPWVSTASTHQPTHSSDADTLREAIPAVLHEKWWRAFQHPSSKASLVERWKIQFNKVPIAIIAALLTQECHESVTAQHRECFAKTRTRQTPTHLKQHTKGVIKNSANNNSIMKVAGCRNEMRNIMTMAMEFMPKEIAFNEHIKMVIKLAREGERNEAFGMVQRAYL
jgi:hypothetical protein